MKKNKGVNAAEFVNDVKKTAKEERVKERVKEREERARERSKEKEKRAKEKEEKVRSARETAQAEEEKRLKESQRRETVVSEVQGVLEKVFELYPKMEGNYIKENGIELFRDEAGHIHGMADGFAFKSTEKCGMLFYSTPVKKGFSNGNLGDNYYCYWFEFDEIHVSLGRHKTYKVDKSCVNPKKVDCEQNGMHYLWDEDFDSVIAMNYDKLEYAKIEKLLNQAEKKRTASVKR